MKKNFNGNEGDKKDKPGATQRPFGGCGISLMWLVLAALAVPWLLRTFIGGGDSAGMNISYSSFRQHLESGNVELVEVSGEKITGVLKEPDAQENAVGEQVEFTEFTTYLPSFGDDELFQLIQQQGVELETRPEDTFSWASMLISFLPFLLLIGLAFFFLRNMRGQGSEVLNMVKNRARVYDRQKEGITFKDVAGADEAKRELEEIVQFLKSPERFERLGGQIPKGVLLVGPPGTGKTLLARAVAGEAGVPFFSITGSDFMEMFVGVGASRVRSLFTDAKKESPSIIFIDELDSIGRKRGAGMGGGHDEREQTLNQMLSELDGFEKNENVIVMAATNRPDILDPALLRPGRFDRRVTVDLPTLFDRLAILKIHSLNKPMAEDVRLEDIARGTPGFSGADLANILNESALIAARRGKNKIDRADINDARDKILIGLKRNNLFLTQNELNLLAYHEAGHAVVAAVLPNADPIHKVTIVPRGRAMGVTQQLPERDRYLYPREYMLDRLAVMMGGRVAEEMFMKTSTSGAENDLKQATQLARKMVLDWGMSERMGPIALGNESDEVFLGEDLAHRREYSDETAREIDQEIRKILQEAFSRARKILNDHREGLERLVLSLLENEEVYGEVVMQLLGLEERTSQQVLPVDGAVSD